MPLWIQAKNNKSQSSSSKQCMVFSYRCHVVLHLPCKAAYWIGVYPFPSLITGNCEFLSNNKSTISMFPAAAAKQKAVFPFISCNAMSLSSRILNNSFTKWMRFAPAAICNSVGHPFAMAAFFSLSSSSKMRLAAGQFPFRACLWMGTQSLRNLFLGSLPKTECISIALTLNSSIVWTYHVEYWTIISEK